MIAGIIGSYAPARAQSLDELHKAALKEGGGLNFYGTLAQINAEIILPLFEKRFPGIKVNHVDATSDKLVARAVSEARGGKTIGDVLQVPLENVGAAPRSGIVTRRDFAGIGSVSRRIKRLLLDLLGFAVFCRCVEYARWSRKKRSPRHSMISSIRAGRIA